MVFLAVKEFQDLCLNTMILIATDNTTVVAYINKQGDEVGPSVCPTVEKPDLVHREKGDSQSTTHASLAECDSRQTIQARPDHSNRMVSPLGGISNNMQPVAAAPSGPFCHQVQQQTTIVCLTGSRPSGSYSAIVS